MQLLDEHAGQDVTAQFKGGDGHVHSAAAMKKLEQYKVGVPKADRAEEILNFDKPLLWQVGPDC